LELLGLDLVLQNLKPLEFASVVFFTGCISFLLPSKQRQSSECFYWC